jgi:hypothetical protein
MRQKKRFDAREGQLPFRAGLLTQIADGQLDIVHPASRISRVRASSSMGVTRNLLLRAFGRPQGMLGRLGGIIMARTNTEFGTWISGLAS